MSISTTSNFARVLGDGSNTVFNFGFVADTPTAISVTYYTGSTVVEVISTSLYTLFINPPAIGQIWGIGGTVIYPLSGTPVPNGDSLLIQRTLPLTQVISISDQGDFSPRVIEEALDTLCMQIQQIAGTEGGDNITGSEIITALGYTPMNGANNLSEIVSAATSRTNLGLGTMAVQNATAIAVTGGTAVGIAISNSSFGGGTIDNSVIGGTTRAAGNFTNLSVSNAFSMATTNNLSPVAWSFVNGGNLGTAQWGPLGFTFSTDLEAFNFNQTDGFRSTLPLRFTDAPDGIILKRGANGRVGVVTLTGTTAVTVNNTNIATSDIINFSLATIGGTVGAVPAIKTITAASGFTVAGSVGDTSTYNYGITKSVI